MKANPRVLVVDDEPSIQFTLARALSMLGCECVVAGDGCEAIRQANAAPFDVVLIDMLMPMMDGIETILALRAKLPNLRIVAMSGDWSANRRNFLPLATRIGAHHTLAKPFGMDDLKTAIGLEEPVAMVI